MTRPTLVIREAGPADTEALLHLWSEAGTPLTALTASHGAESAVRRVMMSATERFVVGEIEGNIVSAMHLRRGPMSPLHVHEVVHMTSLLVLPEFRRHGYARAMLDVAATWAEESGLDYVTALTAASSRDANRFLARMGMGSVATLRMVPVAVLRSKLNPTPRAGVQPLGKVLAQRRSMRGRQPAKTPLELP